MTTENCDQENKPRLRVIDTTGVNFIGPGTNRRHRKRQHHPPVRQPENIIGQLDQQWPLEAMPIQRAIIEYGRRTAALGALQGVTALRSLAERIRGLGPVTPALDQIVVDTEREATRLKTLLDQVYEVDP